MVSLMGFLNLPMANCNLGWDFNCSNKRLLSDESEGRSLTSKACHMKSNLLRKPSSALMSEPCIFKLRRWLWVRATPRSLSILFFSKMIQSNCLPLGYLCFLWYASCMVWKCIAKRIFLLSSSSLLPKTRSKSGNGNESFRDSNAFGSTHFSIHLRTGSSSPLASLQTKLNTEFLNALASDADSGRLGIFRWSNCLTRMIFFSYLYGSTTRFWSLELDALDAFDPLGGVGGPLPPLPLPLLLDDEDDEPGGDLGGVAKSNSLSIGWPCIGTIPSWLSTTPLIGCKTVNNGCQWLNFCKQLFELGILWTIPMLRRHGKQLNLWVLHWACNLWVPTRS